MIWFNAQQIHPLQKSQMVSLERQRQKIKLTAWKYNRLGKLENQSLPKQKALPLQVVEVFFTMKFAVWTFVA